MKRKPRGGPLRVALSGATGKMGVEIHALLNAEEGLFEPTLGWGRRPPEGFRHNCKGYEIPRQARVDVVIDFSTPEALRKLLRALPEDWPLVTGTTGLSQKDFVALEKRAEKSPVLWCPNTSLGVGLLRRALRSLSGAPGFEFAIEEIHHSEKKDAPSGTALRLSADLTALTGQRPSVVSLRGGTEPGTHRVFAFGTDETLTFEHRAVHRRVFARGAVKLAQWLIGQRPGLYTVDDFFDAGGLSR